MMNIIIFIDGTKNILSINQIMHWLFQFFSKALYAKRVSLAQRMLDASRQKKKDEICSALCGKDGLEQCQMIRPMDIKAC